MASIVIPTTKITLKSGDVIALESTAFPNQYWSYINRGGNVNPVELKEDIVNPFSKFTVNVRENSALRLQAANENFLSAILRSDAYPIEADKAPPGDSFCDFTVTTFDDGTIALSSIVGTPGHFLSVIGRPGDINAIEASKQEIDVFCNWKVTLLVG